MARRKRGRRPEDFDISRQVTMPTASLAQPGGFGIPGGDGGLLGAGVLGTGALGGPGGGRGRGAGRGRGKAIGMGPGQGQGGAGPIRRGSQGQGGGLGPPAVPPGQAIVRGNLGSLQAVHAEVRSQFGTVSTQQQQHHHQQQRHHHH